MMSDQRDNMLKKMDIIPIHLILEHSKGLYLIIILFTY